jgi:hypothetical protein
LQWVFTFGVDEVTFALIFVSSDPMADGVALLVRKEKQMRIASIDNARVTLLGGSRMNVAASSRSERWCRESSNRTNGCPVQPRTTTHVELRREPAEVMIGREVRRAPVTFWCEGHLGDWDGLCGHRILVGEGYVQSGCDRLCLSCAEIEAKRVAAAEEAFARALVEGVDEAIGAPVRSAWNFAPSACLSSTAEDPVEKKIEEPDYGSGSMSAAQALLSENEQLAKLARSQETIARILEDGGGTGNGAAGNTNSPVLPLRDEPVDEEVALLVEGIVEEVALIGELCDTLRDRLESIPSGPDRLGIERQPRAEPCRAGPQRRDDDCTSGENRSGENG